MTVVAEFEKPTKCEDCPCFYQTEGAWRDECQLTHKEIENYFIVDESCPIKGKRKRARKNLKTNLRFSRNYINDIPNVIDPCSQCEFKDRSIWDNLEKCRECCYYYSSNFKIETGKTKL